MLLTPKLPLAALVAVGAVAFTQAGSSEAVAKSKCHPNYKGACLKSTASDYDCAGGGGNGPYYVSVTVRVVGSDPFRLDADHDGLGCE